MTTPLDQLRAWVVTADMGLGHQRAAHTLSHLAEGGVLTTGTPETTDPDEAHFWRRLTWSSARRILKPARRTAEGT